MDDIPILGRGDDRVVKQVLAGFDAPAYIRRARRVHEALEVLTEHCRQQRDEWLQLVRTRLGILQALAGAWDRLASWLGPGEQDTLGQLYSHLCPKLRVPVEETSSVRKLRVALLELQDSIERFNRRWQAFLQNLDLTEVNQQRDEYNRYYLLEKECAVRSVRVARQGFQRLEPLTREELAAKFPLLPVLRLKK
jgi:hypothetical protein